MKKKHNKDIGPPIKAGTIAKTEWNTKDEKVQQNIIWALQPKGRHQIPNRT